MLGLRSCGQGHQWEAEVHGTVCPTCGGQALAETEEMEVESLAAGLVPPAVKDISTQVLPRELPPARLPIDPPTVAGFEIVRLVGRGGMGVVFEAWQLNLHRRVALKMILAGAHAGPEALARFRFEAEALADLQHPNIVQVYEVGEHDHCPYMSLEFVEGGSLDQKLLDLSLHPHQAAQLVETLARAMHCAHQRGIVHRDLKPANVLLAQEGQPKITDFGLAKRLEEDSQTQTGTILGTPSYMAPEQAAGKTREVGPLADVYSLCAILYELLTGRPPFVGSTPLQIAAQVVGAEPIPPSRLKGKLPRDLETICLKGLQKDPKKRYASALDLAEDLRRFRADEPIQARPVSAGERTLKWMKRRPALASLVLVGALAGLGFVVGGLWYNARLRAERDRAEGNYVRAERNFERARLAVEQMLTEVAEEQLVFEPGMEQKRRALLERALAFYQEFLTEKTGDPGLRRATALAYKRAADIARILRKDERALEAYAQAIDFLSALLTESPGDPLLRQALADSHNFHGEVLRLSERPTEARRAYEEALQIQHGLVKDIPGDPTHRRDLARTHYNLGILQKITNEPPVARKQFDQAITLLLDLTANYPGDPGYRQHLARSFLNLAPVLRITDGFAKAQETNEKAIALLEELQREFPYVPDYQQELAITYNNLGILLAGAGKGEEAGQAHQRALALFRKLVANSPGVPDYRKELANTCNSLGILQTRARAWPEAERHLNQAREILARLVEEFPDVADYHGHLGMTLGNLAWLLTEQENWTMARPLLEAAIQHLQEVRRPNPKNHFWQQALRAQYQSLAETSLRLGEHAGAARAAQALPKVLGNQAQDYYYAACFLARCALLTAPNSGLNTPRYADLAMEMLRQTLQKDCQGLQRLPNEKEVFRPLESQKDYGELLAALQANAPSPTAKPRP